MQKLVIQVDWSSEKKKNKAIKMVSENQDVQAFYVDDEKKQLKLEGEMDPVPLVKKMRRHFPTEIVSMRNASTADVAPQQVHVPRPAYVPPYTPNPYDQWPPAPPYDGGYDAYYHPLPYGSPQYAYPYNWGSSGGGYGGYNNYHGPH